MKMPAETDLSRLGSGHARALAELEARCFPDPWNEAAFAAAFSRPAFAAFGLFEDGELAAYATFHFLDEEFEVLNVAVAPERRGRGLATRLFADVLQGADKMGMKRGYLEVRAGNVPAKRLYQRHGFVVVGKRKRYYSDTGEDALVMARNTAPAG